MVQTVLLCWSDSMLLDKNVKVRKLWEMFQEKESMPMAICLLALSILISFSLLAKRKGEKEDSQSQQHLENKIGKLPFFVEEGENIS